MSPTAASSHPAPGVHYLLECADCAPALLTELPLLKQTLEQAARQAGATVVETVLHQFNPHGLSGVVVIAESHIAIHTWPEHGYAALDVFTCGLPEIAENITTQLLDAFKPGKHTLTRLERRPPALETASVPH
ncbi:adenosylmethionine decarboxylase [Verrucomicrobiaceae bacterium R5-34]|uniref:S-adenosylmethionine decarboxylase proenzyme n=1 Tax=Oceaniferula flava TaxID=2800421 RepID=A0AAE2SBF3_9BACT|nr:adenosylmethionine decarboxylase [Oceaniferula flavus]MBK1830032.1 adenosylmethionine decarboxylase [Verrucomicrobiaceae bacterium R5-34]MBK1855121.1 adenosylmethionine decarboxylase [Oceaniferula flavus]MBM1136427.1 adenosylmethionine decarboxylase [Oceaniferula flavus]